MIADFFAQNKSQYLEDIEIGNGRAWTVVMGNEAGDLDSVASALAYAWMRVEIHGSLTVPLVQTPRSDLNLRAENSHALSIAGFEPSKREILCVDDLSKFSLFPSNKFALVDHNRLGACFSNDHPDTTVVAIVDHHEDEGLYKDTADPRMIIAPTGSCASLVTGLIEKHCPEDVRIPPELATLLISSIVIDTNGLKPGGKAEKIDIKAVNYLLPRSTLVSSIPSTALLRKPTSPSSTPPKLNPEQKIYEIPALVELRNVLQTKKESVSHLGTRDLLRRDYKEYSITPFWDPSFPTVIGLASVPMGLKSWISLDAKFWDSTQKWMTERNLAALGILTSFREEPRFGEKGRGKHQRELIMVVSANAGDGKLETLLSKGLDGSTQLKLTGFRTFGAKVEGGFGPAVKAKVYRQGNVDATRKVIAPLLKSMIEGLV